MKFVSAVAAAAMVAGSAAAADDSLHGSFNATSFSCPVIAASTSNPTSVHALRPNDIKVVGALGDSITAGFGARATNLINLLTESRGASWIIGGDSDVVTLPNLLKTYNPDLKGFSTGSGNNSRGFGDASISGAVSSGMLRQANTLIDNMRSNLSADEFENDWKMVSIWIGGNDMCSAGTSTANYVGGIEAALDAIQAGLPRTFINLVTMVDVGKLYEISGSGLDIGCSTVRPTVCSRGQDRARSAQEAADWQAGLDELVLSPKYVSDDFTVVLQPWYKEFAIAGNVDRSFLAPDCFHYGVDAMEFASQATWNNLFQPVGEKQTSYLVGEETLCPTDEQPFIFTAQNS
jgi:phospholipase B1